MGWQQSLWSRLGIQALHTLDPVLAGLPELCLHPVGTNMPTWAFLPSPWAPEVPPPSPPARSGKLNLALGSWGWSSESHSPASHQALPSGPWVLVWSLCWAAASGRTKPFSLPTRRPRVVVVWAGGCTVASRDQSALRAPPAHGAQGARLCPDLLSPWGDSQQWTATAGPPGKWQVGLPP